MRCVLLFSQQHLDFRMAELRGICRAHDIDPSLLESIVGVERPIYIVDMDPSALGVLLSRSMLLKSAYEHICDAEEYEELHKKIETKGEYFKPYNIADRSFSVRVRPVGRKKGVNALGRAREVGERLPMGDAPVNLDDPQTAFTIIEEYAGEKEQRPRCIYFGRLIGHGQFSLKNDFNLQERIYIGNTTMDPELSFIQANVSAVGPASIVIDPFCGTGGLLLPAAKFGAVVLGSEINYQIAKAVGRSSRAGVDKRSAEESTEANFKQYGLHDRFLSIVMGDASRHDMWRADEWIDAVVSDPPYGIREKGRKIGFKERKEHWTLPGSEHVQHFPEKQRYALASVFTDLVDFGASRLRVGGRVSFWFPVIREEYSPEVLPSHPAMKLVENCEQTLTLKTSRRLLCYEKTRSPVEGEFTQTARDQYAQRTFRDVMYPENGYSNQDLP